MSSDTDIGTGGLDLSDLVPEPVQVARPGVAMTELFGVGKASHCELGEQGGAHTALRFVWHHILPQVCGGKTEILNLASLCDNCHYAVHAILWALANGHSIPPNADDGQVRLARQGYEAAIAAGTQGKIPKEATGV
jgi:hypothetical protein